ncbi:unnamed protein product [Porites lobata]|uniref:TELO2-interacting protein 2 n=1 Tax=Porites lobata TaxID=104759 RepID=A0ABN8Q0H8_9CNID|nr:unnamed protein product [Porites lobata]
MADEARGKEFYRTLSKFLSDEELKEVKSLLRKNDVEEKLDVKYRDWIKKQDFRTEPCDGDQDEESHYKEKIAAIFEKLLEFAEPVILDEHGWDKEEMMTYHAQAFTVMKICQLLCTVFKDAKQMEPQSRLTQTDKKYVLRKSACCLVSLCAANVEGHPWTDEQSKTTAHELLALICSYCHCSSISDLLCGCVEVNLSETSAKDNPEDSRQTFNTLFPSGLFKHILDYLKPYLLKDTWKKSPLARHVLVWCTLGLKHPFVGDHFPKLMSPLLLFIDDYEVENKVLGLKCLKHVVDNMNSAELQWYGRADVLFEATQRHLYTSEACLVRVLHPCLLSILKVLEPPPTKPKFGRKTTKCDSVFQIMLTSMEFEGKIAMRRACASQLRDYIEHMGITILRHFKRLLRVIVSYLEVSDYPEEEARLAILDALNTAILYAWPRIPQHSSMILKSLLKLLVDTTDSAPYLTTQAYQQLKEKTAECFLLLVRCCGKPFKDQLQELSKGVGHSEVEECAANALKDYESEMTDSITCQVADVT